jgi:uroporphyrin-III C-methyltransferase/precorrin-2 dehydrogenase/sirohydrochlorin ferrochelatase/uroporphyrin-III C-methyltransferase
MNNHSCVYLVGTGPGDPDLLTVKALRLIKNADVIVYDRLISPAIIELIPAGASRIYVGKAADHHTLPQDEINALLVKMAGKARVIVRLKGGDPLVFGRGSEEATYLAKHHIRFEIVPGVTSATAASTYAGIPLTHRGLASGVQIITGHSRDNLPLQHEWEKLANSDTSIVIYMGLANIQYICQKLIQAGLAGDTPAAAIQNGSMPSQKRVIATLATLAEVTRQQCLAPPVLFVIGKVVALAEQMDWYLPSMQSDAITVEQEHNAS